MEIGLGPDEFDCSGFVLRALADTVGREVTPELRHSRQLWQDAQNEQKLVVPGEEAVGNLAVFSYWWDTPEGGLYVPAHIAIVSEVTDAETTLLHAKSSKQRVMESIINRKRLLGFLKLAVFE